MEKENACDENGEGREPICVDTSGGKLCRSEAMEDEDTLVIDEKALQDEENSVASVSNLVKDDNAGDQLDKVGNVVAGVNETDLKVLEIDKKDSKKDKILGQEVANIGKHIDTCILDAMDIDSEQPVLEKSEESKKNLELSTGDREDSLNASNLEKNVEIPIVSVESEPGENEPDAVGNKMKNLESTKTNDTGTEMVGNADENMDNGAAERTVVAEKTVVIDDKDIEDMTTETNENLPVVDNDVDNMEIGTAENTLAGKDDEIKETEKTAEVADKDTECLDETLIDKSPDSAESKKRSSDGGENTSKKLCGDVAKSNEGSQPSSSLCQSAISSQVECVNLHCESGSGLTEAPIFVLTYYGIRYRKNILQRVCDSCYTAAENHFVTLCGMLKGGEPLLRADFPTCKDDVVVMDKVEEICEEEPLSAEVTHMIEDNFNTILTDVTQKYNMGFQITESSYILNTKLDEISATVKTMSKEFEEIENHLTSIRKAIYDPFRPRFKFAPPIDVTAPGAKFEKLIPLSRCPPRVPKETPLPKCVLPPTVVISSDATDVVALAEFTNSRKQLRTGPVKYTALVAGTPVYIIRSSSFGVWLKGKVIEVNLSNPVLPYRVKFDSYRSGYVKSVSGRHLAYAVPSKLAYPIATRVIALFRNKQCPKEDDYYVGIIAEPQKILNKFRYLVFFDDGYAQYVDHENILPVCQVSVNVSDDIHEDCREFIKNYLKQYPERPMVRLQAGQIVRTEWEGKWWPAKVMEIDASLVRMDFENSTRSEWIYRGSTRLKPLYDQLVMRTRSIGTSFLKKRNMPYVEYSVEQDYAQRVASKVIAPGRNVAKKSTIGQISEKMLMMEKPVLPLRPHEATEFPSMGIIRRMDLSGRIRSLVYTSHMCQRSCTSWTNYNHMNTRYIPPLCVPLMVGFTRLQLRTRLKRVVIYTTPCGRKVRSISELRTYLMTTRCNMGVDLFDFDHWVRVTDEFHLEPSMYKTHIADISDGAENMAVSCVNEIFDAWPQVMKYSTRRIPQKGVNLNTDTEFMICCDCTDDCSNRNRCACWQLTIRGTAQGPEGVVDSTVGYFYRRLAEPVSTGIYECHAGCKCSKATCQNRVVQHPLSQRLQVFRTLRKGWGLRTLNDIPTGSFICIYVGRLHTEASANEGGRVYGDEYLAELDYIEVVEQFKEGYENEMVDPEEKDEDEEHYSEDNSWESREMAKDKDFRPEFKFKGPGKDRSVSTRAQKGSVDDDPNTITIDDDDEDVHRQMSKFTADVRADGTNIAKQRRSVREMLGDTKEDIYIMDAKYEGNIGRYLNHSCQPNVFVQNVFVDTHDVRFPWIAFFAMSHIRAGTELTWDYNYNIGSVSEKVLYCYCGTPECRGRLL